MKKKIISLNIEGKRHLDKVKSFLERENADIVCLMEVCEEDVLTIAGEQYPFVVYGQNDVLGNNRAYTTLESIGTAILSKEVMIDIEKYHFGEQPRTFIDRSGGSSHAPILLTAKIGELMIGAVHFTWTPDGKPSDAQRKHLKLLLDEVRGKDIILCGDFNTPRGNELYNQISKELKDNIPQDIDTTLDPVLHYANREVQGKLRLVVDYVWTRGYVVNTVQVVSSVSDHCALVFDVDLF